MKQELAELLFPHIKETPEEIEKRYPDRNLKEGALVTRYGPSPTGFMHIGNLYGAFISNQLANNRKVFFIYELKIPIQNEK